MVMYCSVKECGNNSGQKKKDPNALFSFHLFPVNQELKTKWLKAIGRPNWVPPGYAKICSIHFNKEQFNIEGQKIRIKDGSVPVNNLPVNSNFDASEVEACRICLATDVKLYSLQDSQLSTCMESMAGFNENHNIGGLPQYVCYQCTPILMKCYKLIEKSMTAQATLLDIFAKTGQITKDLIKQQNRFQLNLNSSLAFCSKINYYEFKYDDDTNISYKTPLDGTDIYLENENEEKEVQLDCKTGFIIENDLISDEIELVKNETDEMSIYNDDHFEDSFGDGSSDNNISDHDTKEVEEGSSDDNISDHDTKEVEEGLIKTTIAKRKRLKSPDETVRKKSARVDAADLTPEETVMLKYFDIVSLSLQEQLEKWEKAAVRKLLCSDTVYECEVCSKVFTQANSYQAHISSHDESQGEFECPVCKLRFKSAVLAKSHGNRAHGKKFYCKTCPKVISTLSEAKKHHRWHNGYKYSCTSCPFRSANSTSLSEHVRRAHACAYMCSTCGRTFISAQGLNRHVAIVHNRGDELGYSCPSCPFRSEHESALGEHVRRAHAYAYACGACGRACVSARGLKLHVAAAHKGYKDTAVSGAYRCEECNINFASEGARRVHLLTSSQHNIKTNLCDSSQSDELRNACKKCGVVCSSFAELVAHRRTQHQRRRMRPGDNYPTDCELCGKTVSCRQSHWHHVRSQHPNDINTYQAVVTAVCDTCGKGFQNAQRLRLHQLRHSAPAVRCDVCPRVFYDKYALARHAFTHTAIKPYQCRTCGRAFKLRGNLIRHTRVHSDIANYECKMCGKMLKYSTSLNLHIRTVHYKQPHPPRKKRSRSAKEVANDI